MGSEKTTTTTDSNQTQKATPTAEETRLNQLDLQLREQGQEGLGRVQASGLNLSDLLLRGLNLPGNLEGLPGGISEGVTQDLVNQSLRDIKPGFQQGGILDSGVAASVSARTAGDIRRGSAEFNINNLMQLLNLAVGGQAQVQQPILAQSQALGGRLAGLRSINQTGTGTSTVKAMNPFMKSFQTQLGKGTGQFLVGGS